MLGMRDGGIIKGFWGLAFFRCALHSALLEMEQICHAAS